MRLFISYAHIDISQVMPVVDILRRGNHDPWYDHQLLPGQSWKQALINSIEQCDAFVYMLTPDSVASEWCQWEFAEAVKMEKPVVPVLLSVHTELPHALREIQYADFTNGVTLEAAVRLMAGLHRLAIIPPQNVPVAPENPRGRPSRAEIHIRETGEASIPVGFATFLKLETVLIPAGDFVMGSTVEHLAAQIFPDWYYPREQPQRRLDLPDYHIGKYPVTVGEYRVFIELGGYHERGYWTDAGWAMRGRNGWTQPRHWDDPKWTSDDDLPVIGVSWYEAVAYCRWLTEVTGCPYRLPSEAEWEKAARSADGRIYAWGNTWHSGMCNTLESDIGQTTPVAQFSPDGDSPYGVADMNGNILEWCATEWREVYDPGAPNRLEGRERRVLRGGSWQFERSCARCSFRLGSSPYNGYTIIGFRVIEDTGSSPFLL